MATITRNQTVAVVLVLLIPTVVESIIKTIVLAIKVSSDDPTAQGRAIGSLVQFLPYDAGGQMYTRISIGRMLEIFGDRPVRAGGRRSGDGRVRGHPAGRERGTLPPPRRLKPAVTVPESSGPATGVDRERPRVPPQGVPADRARQAAAAAPSGDRRVPAGQVGSWVPGRGRRGRRAVPASDRDHRRPRRDHLGRGARPGQPAHPGPAGTRHRARRLRGPAGPQPPLHRHVDDRDHAGRGPGADAEHDGQRIPAHRARHARGCEVHHPRRGVPAGRREGRPRSAAARLDGRRARRPERRRHPRRPVRQAAGQAGQARHGHHLHLRHDRAAQGRAAVGARGPRSAGVVLRRDPVPRQLDGGAGRAAVPLLGPHQLQLRPVDRAHVRDAPTLQGRSGARGHREAPGRGPRRGAADDAAPGRRRAGGQDRRVEPAHHRGQRLRARR